MDLPGSKIPVQEVICPLAMHKGSTLQENYDHEDEFDFIGIATVLLKRKYFILAITLIAAIAGSVYAFSKPNIYKAEVLVIPSKKSGNYGGGVSTQMGGVASLLGLGAVAGGGGENSMYLALMHTPPFAEYTIKEFNLMPLFAAEIDKKNPASVKLDRAVGMLLGGIKTVSANNELGGGERISFTSKSPELAAKIAGTLVDSINKYAQLDTIKRAEKSSAIAISQIQQTTVLMMKNVLWDIAANKTQEIVLAQAQDDFLFRVIYPAGVPGEPFSPNRGKIIAGFAAIGFLFGILPVLAWDRPSFRKKRS